MPQLFDELTFEIDHIIAVKHQGKTEESNLALACFACNHHKGSNIAGFDLVSQQTVPLFHPRRDTWNHHFSWNGPILRGLTPIGTVTTHVLAINLEYRMALRQTLIDEGAFPTERA